MPSLFAIAALCLFAHYWITTLLNLRRNLKAAKASGLPYVVAPVHGINIVWLSVEQFLLPQIRKLPLPKAWTEDWTDCVAGDWVWESRRAKYDKLGQDVFIVVSPGGNIVNVADAEVINQITTRRADFPKPLKVYKTLDIYGKNVVTHEGGEWRRHRKIVSPPFTENNNRLVWMETLYQAQTMLTSWVGKDGGRSETIEEVSTDAMRLSLHVISRAGFDVRCLWPGVNDDDQEAIAQGAMSTNIIPEGHKMSYVESMTILLHNIILVITVPDTVAKYFPLKIVRDSRTAHLEWGHYMREIYERKYAQMKGDKNADAGMDLMDAMIKGSGLLDPKTTGKNGGLDVSEILGNSFVFMLAGHETAANTIHFSILFLALHPSCQRRLQKELDAIFKGKPPQEWDYDTYLNPLFGGMAGAIMNETLRVIPPVVSIPKSTPRDQDQPVTMNGKEYIIPRDSYVALNSVSVHRNPKYWPSGPPSDPKHPYHPLSNLDNDLEEWKPERWLLDPAQQEANGHADSDGNAKEVDDLNINTAPDTAATLFRPPKGAYVPFSEGFRSCIGRRFAQVEILAALAVVFQNYSVELAVDEWASDEEIARLQKEGNKEELRKIWGKASDRAENLLLKGMGTIITIQLRKGLVPFRFVRRGEERFNGLIER